MMRFVHGMVVGAMVVACGTAAIMTALDPRASIDADRMQRQQTAIALFDAEQERDRLRLQLEWKTAEAAAWRKLAIEAKDVRPKQVD